MDDISNTTANPIPPSPGGQHDHDSAPRNAEPSSPPVDTMVPPRRRRMFQGLIAACAVRPLGWLASVGIVIGMILPPTGLGPSTCGMQRGMGVPCPGCGLTRSVSSFLQGQFNWSFQYHPMGWAFAAMMILLAVTSFLPARWRDPAIARLSRFDTPFGWGLIAFCVLLLIYGITRIVLVQTGADGWGWWAGDGSEPPPFVPVRPE